jgi:hypothetical protein
MMQTGAKTILTKPPILTKHWWIGAGLFVLLVLLIGLAPLANWRNSGSTYSRSPDGYGAWYAYMERTQQQSIERWRKPLTALINRTQSQKTPTTLLRIQPNLITPTLDRRSAAWVKAGNHLIVLGVRQPVAKIPFSSQVSSARGLVAIDTSRRAPASLGTTELNLKDSGGWIVWQPPQYAGKLTYAVTPHLAANAYQKQPGNFAFLAQLVMQSGQSIVVDEYLHGYQDVEPVAPSPGAMGRLPRHQPKPRQTVLDYLLKTPLMLVLVQAIVVVGMAVWAKNQRFGPLRSLVAPAIDNTTAYVQALAGALRQANSGQFVVETVTQAELKRLQRQLGLTGAIDIPALKTVWIAQNGDSPEINAAWQQLITVQRRQAWDDRDLAQWLQALQKIRQAEVTLLK